MKIFALTIVFGFIVLSCSKKEETTLYDEPLIATETAETSVIPMAPDTTTVIPTDTADTDVDTISARP